MKSVLIDSSSAILLFKSGWLDATLNHFLLKTGRAASRELTIPGYPGASRFQLLLERARIEVLPPIPAPSNNRDTALTGMGDGERECIRHFLAGAGRFILIDDGRAAAYCRAHRIPYVNALLMPRILALADSAIDGAAIKDAMATIYKLGRYAPWVRDHARNCSDTTLHPFSP